MARGKLLVAIDNASCNIEEKVLAMLHNVISMQNQQKKTINKLREIAIASHQAAVERQQGIVSYAIFSILVEFQNHLSPSHSQKIFVR